VLEMKTCSLRLTLNSLSLASAEIAHGFAKVLAYISPRDNRLCNGGCRRQDKHQGKN
jgi:hypothetical protein